MRRCRHTGGLDCTEPMFLCRTCPVAKKATEEAKSALVPAPKLPVLPDPRPFISIGGNPSGAPGYSITIGVKGTF